MLGLGHEVGWDFTILALGLTYGISEKPWYEGEGTVMYSLEGQPRNYLGNVSLVHLITFRHTSKFCLGWLTGLYQYELLGIVNGYASTYVTCRLFTISVIS